MSELRKYLEDFAKELAKLLDCKDDRGQPLTDDKLRKRAKELWGKDDPRDRRYRLTLWGVNQIRKGPHGEDDDEENILVDKIPRE